MEEILYKNEVYNIQGAIFDVYREMGCGFLETVYQECLESERNRDTIRLARKLRKLSKGSVAIERIVQ